MRNHSYIVIDRATGEAVLELFNPEHAKLVRRTKFVVRTAHAYLANINVRIKLKNEDIA